MKTFFLWLVLANAASAVAQVKVSELPAAASVELADIVPIVASGQTRKATIGQVADAVVGRDNDYTGTFAGSSVNVTDGTALPFSGDALGRFSANAAFGVQAHSEQSNAVLATSRNGQAGKFAQLGWDAESSDTPVVRVARGSGTDGVNHSPLVVLETVHPDWSDGDALVVKRAGVETFRLTAEGAVHGAGLVLPQTAVIPTNAVPVGSGSETNWMLVNLGGRPTFVATNHAAGGWLQKTLWP